jgi:hypothetical protein
MTYTSAPSEEVDEAWDKLVSRGSQQSTRTTKLVTNILEAIYFSATADEVKQSNEDPDDTVRIIEDGGYLGTIGVYHGIHCLVSHPPFLHPPHRA